MFFVILIITGFIIMKLSFYHFLVSNTV